MGWLNFNTKVGGFIFGFLGRIWGGAANFGGGVCRFGAAAREGVGDLLPLETLHGMGRSQWQKVPDPVGAARLSARWIAALAASRSGMEKVFGLAAANSARRAGGSCFPPSLDAA